MLESSVTTPLCPSCLERPRLKHHDDALYAQVQVTCHCPRCYDYDAPRGYGDTEKAALESYQESVENITGEDCPTEETES